MNVKIQGRQLLVNNKVVTEGSAAELKDLYLQYRYGGKAAPAAAAAPSRKGLDMSKGELRFLKNGKWQVWHPGYNHPVFGHSVFMGSEDVCRKILGLAPSAKSQAIAAEHLAAARETLRDDPYDTFYGEAEFSF